MNSYKVIFKSINLPLFILYDNKNLFLINEETNQHVMFESILKYITDKQTKLSTKAYVTIIGITLFIAIDKIVGFSYHYFIDKKIEEVELVGRILKDTTLEKNNRKELITLRQDILSKKYFYDYIADEVESIINNDSSIKEVSNKNSNIQEPRNNFIFLMSSSACYIIIYLVVLIAYLFDKKFSILQRIAMEIIIVVLGVILISILNWILGYVPKISQNTWNYNYVLNFLIQITLIGLTVYFSYRKKK